MTRDGSVLRSATLGGVLGALLVATPLLNSLNSCCCLLVVATSAFAGWSLRSDTDGRAPAGSCAAAGMLSGILSGLIGVPLRALCSRLAFGVAHLESGLDEALDEVRRTASDAGLVVPPGLLEGVEAGARASSGLELNGWLVVTAVLAALGYGLFGILGGFIGARLGQRSGPPAGPREASPPPPAPPAASMAAPPAPPPPPLSASEPPVVGPDGEPDVRWTGPTLAAAPPVPAAPDAAPAGDDGAPPPGEEGERGEIPHDELPLLPAREPAERETEPEADAPTPPPETRDDEGGDPTAPR